VQLVELAVLVVDYGVVGIACPDALGRVEMDELGWTAGERSISSSWALNYQECPIVLGDIVLQPHPEDGGPSSDEGIGSGDAVVI
jgi:hypothetical protein